MGKRQTNTPRSQIRSALRRLFLRSRERAAALKRDKYTCQCCGLKQSRAKGREVFVEVHHKEGVVNWNIIFDLIFTYLLCPADKLITLCKKCHDESEENK